MKLLIEYITLLSYFLFSFLAWGSAVFMKRVWYVPAALGAWFFMIGLFFLVSILQENWLTMVNLLVYLGTPGLFIVSVIVMRAYWVLSTRRFHERHDDPS